MEERLEATASRLAWAVNWIHTKQKEPITLYRENQRIGLRAFLRTMLQHPQVAESKSMATFLTKDPVKLNEEET